MDRSKAEFALLAWGNYERCNSFPDLSYKILKSFLATNEKFPQLCFENGEPISTSESEIYSGVMVDVYDPEKHLKLKIRELIIRKESQKLWRDHPDFPQFYVNLTHLEGELRFLCDLFYRYGKINWETFLTIKTKYCGKTEWEDYLKAVEAYNSLMCNLQHH